MMLPKNYHVAKRCVDPNMLLNLDYNMSIPEDLNNKLECICKGIAETELIFPNGASVESSASARYKHRVEHCGSEIKTVWQEYRPFSVKFQGARVSATDLYSGEKHDGKRSPLPELDGYGSVISNVLDTSIASWISAISQQSSLECVDGSLPDDGEAIIREISHDVGSGDIWYVPVFQIPTINRKELVFSISTNQHFQLLDTIIDIRRMKRYKSHFPGYTFPNAYQLGGHLCDIMLLHSIPFYASGSVFLDGFHGNYLPGTPDFVSDIYFNEADKTDPKFTMKITSSLYIHPEDGRQHTITIGESPWGRPGWLNVGALRNMFASSVHRYHGFGRGREKALEEACDEVRKRNEYQLIFIRQQHRNGAVLPSLFVGSHMSDPPSEFTEFETDAGDLDGITLCRLTCQIPKETEFKKLDIKKLGKKYSYRGEYIKSRFIDNGQLILKLRNELAEISRNWK